MAIEALATGAPGHRVYEAFSAMAPNIHDPVVAQIELTYDYDMRQARLRIPGIGFSHAGDSLQQAHLMEWTSGVHAAFGGTHYAFTKLIRLG